MESSPKFSGDAEECSSSESGWTMYLASPMHSDQHNNSDVCDDGAVAAEDGGTIGGQKEEEEEEDDSMASDASSGTPYKKWNEDVDGVKERSSMVERGKGRERSSKRRDSADSIHGSYKIRKARSSHK